MSLWTNLCIDYLKCDMKYYEIEVDIECIHVCHHCHDYRKLILPKMKKEKKKLSDLLQNQAVSDFKPRKI